MPNGLRNWTYKDVIAFLKQRDFEFSEQKIGSHEHWVSPDKKYVVDVNRITGNASYPIRTLESIIRDSGIIKKEWRNWNS